MRILALRTSILVFALAAVFDSSARLAEAQQPPRRPLFESLLRGVLEQQIERANRNRTSNSPAPAANLSVTQLSAAFQAFERDIDRLANDLSRVAQTSSSAAALYKAAVRLRATASRAVVMSSSRDNQAALSTFATTIDREWKDLEFGLKEAFQANQSLQTHINALNRSEQQISELFAIKPQFSQRDAMRELDAFADTIAHIIEDIDFELRFSNDRARLTLPARRIRQTATYLITFMETNPNGDETIRQFTALDREWRQLAVQLRGLNARHMDRDIHRAEESLNEVRRILRVPQTLDREELGQLATALMRDVEELFKHITLSQLIEIRSPQSIIPAASEFYGFCEHFQLTVNNDFRRDNLVENFRDIDESWRQLSQRLTESRNRDTLQSMEGVDHSLGTIRLLLGAPGRDDRKDSQEATSALAVLSRQLETNVINRMRASREYTPSFRRSMELELKQFTGEAARLNDATVRGNRRMGYSSEVQQLAERWGRLQMLLAKLAPRDRPYANLISSQISEQLLRLGVR